MKDILNSCNNRFQLWAKFIQTNNLESVAEVGVYKGDFAAFTLERCSNIKTYIMIDPWRNLIDWNKPANTIDDEFESYFNETKQRTESFASKRKILRGKTTEVINKIADNSLDFIYIDGDHTLKGISIDLINVWSKIKVGGYIAGDDFCPSIWQHTKNYEPSFVFPFAVYFAEAIGAKISALPFNQFLIEKVDTGFEFKDYTDQFYKNTSVLSQLSDLISNEQGLKKISFLTSFFKNK